MFDPFDQVHMRTQQLLASATRIREERALRTAARDRTMETTTAADPAVAVASAVAVVADACPPGSACAETLAKPASARTRAA